MQVQNDTDEDLEFEVDGSRPGDETFRGVVARRGTTAIPAELGPIVKARILKRGDQEVFWEQEFRGAEDLVFRDAIIQPSQ